MRVRALIRQVCRAEKLEMLKGHVPKDHAHLFASIPPHLTVSRFVQRVKGKGLYKLLNEFQHLRRTYGAGAVTKGRGAISVAVVAMPPMRAPKSTSSTNATKRAGFYRETAPNGRGLGKTVSDVMLQT